MPSNKLPVTAAQSYTDYPLVVSAAYGGSGSSSGVSSVTASVLLMNYTSSDVEYQVGSGSWQTMRYGTDVTLDIDLSSTTLKLRRSISGAAVTVILRAFAIPGAFSSGEAGGDGIGNAAALSLDSSGKNFIYPDGSVGSSNFAHPNPFYFGARGDGVTDDSTAISNWIAAAPAGSTLLVPPVMFAIQPDVLAWNKAGILLQGSVPAKSLAANTRQSGFKILTNGGFGVKVGNAANYTGGTMIQGGGIKDIALNFNGKKFTDAGLVVEGCTLWEMESNKFSGAGLNSTGNRSRALRFRVVWDSWVRKNYFTQLHSDDSVFYYDDQFNDPNGNVNNIRWMENHHETITGTWFKTSAASNADKNIWAFNKMERGGVSPAAPGYLFDLDNAQDSQICHNVINLFTPAECAALFRVGASAGSWHNKISQNKMYQITVPVDILNGAQARETAYEGNEANNTNTSMAPSNLANGHWIYEPTRTNFASGTLMSGRFPTVNKGTGWITAARLPAQGSVQNYVADTTSVSPEQIVFQRSDNVSAGQVALAIPMGGYKDYPVAATLYVRCKKTSTGSVGSLDLIIKSSLVGSVTLADNTNWQVISFPLSTVNMASLGDNGADRWRLVYGTSNASVISIDAVLIR